MQEAPETQRAKTGNTFIGARFNRETEDRIDKVTAAMSRKLKMNITRAKLLNACVAAHLPVMEEEWLAPKAGIVLLELKASVSQLESNTIKERIGIVIDHKFDAGEQIGYPCYGFTPVPTGRLNKAGKPVCRLDPHPQEMPWLMKIIEWRQAGRSQTEIAAELNRSNVRTKRHGSLARKPGATQARVVLSQWDGPKLSRLLSSRQVMRLVQQLKQTKPETGSLS